MTRFLIMHQTVTSHDAIGNDIERMYEILKEKYPCKIYAQNKFNTRVEYLPDEELDAWLEDKNTILIYHHSVYWEFGEDSLHKCKGKIIFRYHNITPPEFFEPYNDFHYQQCSLGREQTTRLAKDFLDAYWMSDSEYNTLDVTDFVSKDRIGICAPFNKIEQWAEKTPDEQILKELLVGDTLNVLFVGRIAPNKGYKSLIRILHYYCANFDCNVKLRMVGKFDEGIAKFNEELRTLIAQCGLKNNVEFIGEINDATLMSYYLGSDVFLCTSEHEGFCVPIIEAQFFQLPIITTDSTAIPETIGSNQLVLKDNEKNFAAALRVLKENEEYRRFLRTEGRKNFDQRFCNQKIADTFKSIMNEWCGVVL